MGTNFGQIFANFWFSVAKNQKECPKFPLSRTNPKAAPYRDYLPTLYPGIAVNPAVLTNKNACRQLIAASTVIMSRIMAILKIFCWRVKRRKLAEFWPLLGWRRSVLDSLFWTVKIDQRMDLNMTRKNDEKIRKKNLLRQFFHNAIREFSGFIHFICSCLLVFRKYKKI